VQKSKKTKERGGRESEEKTREGRWWRRASRTFKVGAEGDGRDQGGYLANGDVGAHKIRANAKEDMLNIRPKRDARQGEDEQRVEGSQYNLKNRGGDRQETHSNNRKWGRKKKTKNQTKRVTEPNKGEVLTKIENKKGKLGNQSKKKG